MYIRKQDFKNAYTYYVLYKQYNDSTNQQGFQLGLANARAQFESERKEKELEFLSLELEQREYMVYGLGGILFMILVIGLLIFNQFRLNSKRRITEMNHQLSEMTQQNLRQQMNPHFIFNTLNSIQYYMYQHDKISTNNYLTKFSSLMRKILENSQHTSIAIKDELDAIQLYLELETLRFKEKFDYEIHVDEDIDTLLYKIPTMLIQPYVENAIGHGLIHKEGKGFLKIEFALHDSFINCSIEDNGIGREAAMEIRKNRNNNHNSLGTRIAEARLNLVNSLYSKTMKIRYTDLKDDTGHPAGTHVEIQIPVMT
jgi:LytS/YehU family sensor histidine kinase